MSRKTRIRRSSMLIVLMTTTACSKEKQRDPGEPTPFEIYQSQRRIQGKDRAVGTAQPSPPVSTGNNDRDFLRSIGDHEKNVIALSDAALEWNRRPEIEDLVRRMEERHGHDLDTVTSLLRNTFNDRYVSQAASEMRSTADALRRPESDHRGLLLNAALKAEQDALKLIDSYLPKVKRPDVRRLALRLRMSESTSTASIKQLLAGVPNR